MRVRFWIGIVAVALVAIGSVVAALLVYENDNGDFHKMQEDEAVRAAHQAEAVAALSVGKLSSAAAFFQADEHVSKHEFSVIGHSLLGEGALSAAAFAPRVGAGERAAYEQRYGIEIQERRTGRLIGRAGPRPVYYPVTFATRYGGSARLLGYDLGSDEARGPAIERARDSGKAVATPLVPLLLGGSGINVFRPIYRDGAPLATVADRRRALVGFVGGSFRVGDLAKAAIDALPDGVDVQLRVDHQVAVGPAGELDDAAAVPIGIADRTWLLVVKEPGGPDLTLPLVLAAMGIALAALLGSLIFAWSRGERLQELERQASQDALTGLNNRRRFEEDLRTTMARSRRDGSSGALLMLDLDEFKQVNDSYGHPAGDRLIREIAAVLRKRTRESDALARLGGDEFAVILPRCNRAEALLVGEAIAAAVREHRPEGPLAAVTASVGITMFGENPRTSLASVISEADAAMYVAKDAGRDQVRVFEPNWVREDAPGV
ncbi:MAG TPA: diguanylate cyclase [Solirubrobacterales bacterium]|nr:diguanylate cyclase [Solirubrobacterales bacterium]